MDIGKKIRAIRIEKLMTQSELAGNIITRNMLSQIENGIAQPSLNTVCYLSERLGVPVGYLLSEGDEEFIYYKSRLMKNIKKAYSDENFELCREICLTSFEKYDDELELILVDCCVGSAERALKDGRLREARNYLDEGLRHSDKTIYSSVTQKNRIYIMFHLLKNISPSLDSNEIDTEISMDLLNPALFGDVFGRYIALIYNALNDDSKILDADVLSNEDKLFALHIRAKKNIRQGEFKRASALLESIIDSDIVPPRLLIYMCCEDMEKCCKEMGDYKGAYEFSNNKMEILEHMLSEV